MKTKDKRYSCIIVFRKLMKICVNVNESTWFFVQCEADELFSMLMIAACVSVFICYSFLFLAIPIDSNYYHLLMKIHQNRKLYHLVLRINIYTRVCMFLFVLPKENSALRKRLIAFFLSQSTSSTSYHRNRAYWTSCSAYRTTITCNEARRRINRWMDGWLDAWLKVKKYNGWKV